MARNLKQQDRFANIAAGDVTLTAADALTFDEVLTGISLGVGVGMLVDEIDYMPTVAALNELVAGGDAIHMGWATSNSVTNLEDIADRRILHAMILKTVIVGAVVSLWTHKTPFVHQFFPPIIVAAPRLFFGADQEGGASARQFRSRLYYRFIELNAQEYLEIAETFQLTS